MSRHKSLAMYDGGNVQLLYDAFEKVHLRGINLLLKKDISYLNNNDYIVDIKLLSFTHSVQSVVSYCDSLPFQVM